MFSRKYLFLTTVLVLGVSAVTLRALPSDPEELDPLFLAMPTEEGEESEPVDSLELMTDEQIDSLRMARLQSEFNEIQNIYRQIRIAKTDQETNEADLYPVVYKSYEMATEFYDKLDKDDSRRGQLREMFRDIDSELQYGTYFYSGQNNTQEMSKYARAYIDIQLMPEFKNLSWRRDTNFPNVVYICASDAYNKKEYEKAIDYFKLYFATGAETYREKIYIFMGQACINAKQYDLGVVAMAEGAKIYPTNDKIIALGLQACINGGHGELIQDFLNKGLALSPNDEGLLDIQGKLYEDQHNYQGVVNIYSQLDQMKPNNLKITQRLAMGYYNLGVSNYNEAIRSTEEKTARKYNRLAKDYFSASAELFRTIIASDPTSIKYLTALAVAYNCLDNKAGFEEMNSRIIALGGTPVNDIYMPPVMTANADNSANYGTGNVNSNAAAMDVPSYSSYSKEYVTSRLEKWGTKGEFERESDFAKRVNDATISAKYEELSRECANEYLRLYTNSLRINDLKLKPYDTEYETFGIESEYGPIVLRVPMKNNEAETFKMEWNQIRFQAPTFFINSEGQVRIGSMDFTTPSGKTYTYRDDAGLQYGSPAPVVDFQTILATHTQKQPSADTQKAQSGKLITVTSDVDKNIPQYGKENSNTVALIIANEKYSNVPDVDFASHDGNTFREYCVKTLGIPEHNIRYLNNATYGQMLGAINNVSNLVKSMSNPDLIVYYAGHGIPDEATKDAFILPVDGSAGLTNTAMSLDHFYKELGNLPAQKVMVFLDACFSGGTRNGEAISATRSVSIASKPAAPKGNMMILSATSSEETAMPYKEKGHGMFTYFLLKKLQESKGNCTLQELSDYVVSNVKLESNRINYKQQTPTVNRSGALIDGWKKEKLR